jgi:hypothetical protein
VANPARVAPPAMAIPAPREGFPMKQCCPFCDEPIRFRQDPDGSWLVFDADENERSDQPEHGCVRLEGADQ